MGHADSFQHLMVRYASGGKILLREKKYPDGSCRSIGSSQARRSAWNPEVRADPGIAPGQAMA